MLILKEELQADAGRTGSRIEINTNIRAIGYPCSWSFYGRPGSWAARQQDSQPDDHADAFVRGRGGHGSLPAS